MILKKMISYQQHQTTHFQPCETSLLIRKGQTYYWNSLLENVEYTLFPNPCYSPLQARQLLPTSWTASRQRQACLNGTANPISDIQEMDILCVTIWQSSFQFCSMHSMTFLFSWKQQSTRAPGKPFVTGSTMPVAVSFAHCLRRFHWMSCTWFGIWLLNMRALLQLFE